MESTNNNILPIEVLGWHLVPGIKIKRNGENEQKTQMIYKKFLKEVSPTRENIKLLIPHCINDIHHSIPLFLIFIIFVEDQIELYQSQRDHRNAKIDEKWNDIKYHIAKEHENLFANQNNELAQFIDELKKLLHEEDILSHDFDTTINTFQNIIKKPYVGDMNVLSLFVPEARRNSIHSTTDFCDSFLPRTVVENSFRLTINQLYKNYKWVHEKIEPILRKEIEKQIIEKYKHMYEFFNLTSFAESLFKFEKTLLLFLSLDPTDIESLIMAHKKFKADITSFIIKLPSFEAVIKGLKIYSTSNKPLINTITREECNFSKKEQASLLQSAEEVQFSISLFETYVRSFIVCLLGILESLESAPKDKTAFSLLPFAKDRIAEQQAIEKEKQILKELASKKPSKKKRNRKNPNSSQTTTIPALPSSNPAPTKAPEIIQVQEIVPVAPKKDDLETQLLKLFTNNSSSLALREMIWHLDQLTTLQAAYSHNDLGEEDYLNYFLGVALNMQKLLEQGYRYRLERAGLNVRMHDLKDYHRMVFKNMICPSIVNLLRLTNNWARDFHSSHDQLASLTTTRFTIPPLLLELTQIDQNPNHMTRGQLQKRIDNILKDGYKVAEHIITPFLTDKNEATLVQNSEIKIDKPIDASILQKVEKALILFLRESKLPKGHPSTLKIKQALSAFKMLKSSLQQLNKVQTTREFPTWVSWSLRQLQDGMEGVLHAIEFFKLGQISRVHELSQLAATLKFDIGSLGSDFEKLAYKHSYPAENIVEGKAAKLIDNAEAIHQWPDFDSGMTLQGTHSKLIWNVPEEEISISSIMASLTTLLDETNIFLENTAIPELKKLRQSVK